jgi:hypothetical protein
MIAINEIVGILEPLNYNIVVDIREPIKVFPAIIIEAGKETVTETTGTGLPLRVNSEYEITCLVKTTKKGYQTWLQELMVLKDGVIGTLKGWIQYQTERTIKIASIDYGGYGIDGVDVYGAVITIEIESLAL